MKAGSPTSNDSGPPFKVEAGWPSRPPSTTHSSTTKKAPPAPPNHHDAEGTNKGLDEGLLNPAPPLHDPLFGFGDARPPVPLPLLHKEEDVEGGLVRLKHIGACRAPGPVRFGGGEAALILRVGGGESGSRGREIELGPEAVVVVSGGLIGAEEGDGGRTEGGGGSDGSGG